VLEGSVWTVELPMKAVSALQSLVAGQKLGTQTMEWNVLWMTAVFGEVDYVRTDHRNIHSLHFLLSSVVLHLSRHSFHSDYHYFYPHSFLPTFLKVYRRILFKFLM
jgi:hypothetical protein